ncbi:HAD family hydrolase [Nocardia sp. NPDC058058]|uniref:HAD family hydrolase n=1 Tax=Nocardia sp. NPDC058058 TaxID=3346317 RepID=UPI0036D760B0
MTLSTGRADDQPAGMSVPIDAVLFDLDGTLVATMEPWDRCWFDFAAGHGHAWTDADRRRTHGHGDWADHLAEVCGIDSAARVIEECTGVMIEQVRAGRIELLPGVKELVRTATNAGAMGVVSASPGRFVHATLEHFGLHRHWDLTLTREDLIETKPDPAPYLHAAARLGVFPEHCVAVEDSAAGIRSAATAGMRVLAIPSWADHPHPAEAVLAEYLAPDAARADLWLRTALEPTIAELRALSIANNS